MPFLITHWRTVVVLVLVGVLGAYGMTMRLQRDGARLELANFKDSVSSAAAKQAKAALAQTVADERRKEKADADHEATVAALNARIVSLRARRADSSLVPPAPAGAERPDLACFDRSELIRALRELDSGLQGLADEGSKAVTDLDTAKRWAQEK